MCTYVSIDPGTNKLGITVNHIDEFTGMKSILHSSTIDINKFAELKYGETWVVVHGLRRAKMIAVYDIVFSFLRAWNPETLVCESPYMGRFPQAFSALVECLDAIRNAAFSYNPNMLVHFIDPATIKKAVGAKGNSGDKDMMRKMVIPLLANSHLNPDWLDEHAIDSIGVGEAYFKQTGA